MNVKPILFGTDMVHAILEHRKTMTRRVIRPQPQMELSYTYAGHECGKWCYAHSTEHCSRNPQLREYWTPPCHCGDILWVRETWAEWTGGYVYKAGIPPFAQPGESTIMKWHPSIHMPKDAARLWLKVTGVRVERLQDITNEDIIKEGADREAVNRYIGQMPGNVEERERAAHIMEFSQLWDSLIRKGKPDIQAEWDANPWVWSIEFERCKKPEEEKR